MLHSDYPLQALLYSVVLHRFLRWRQPGYDPERASGRSDVSVPARDVRAGYAGGRRPSVRGCSAGGRPSLVRRCRICSTRGGRRHDGRRMATGAQRHRAASDVHRCRGDRALSDVHVAQRLTALARRRTRRSRSPLRWRCGRCGTDRCAWTCGRLKQQIGVDGLPWPDADHGWRLGEPARRDSRPCCTSMGICCISTGTGWRSSRCAAMCSR